MIKILYSRHYSIQQLFVCPSDQGHRGVARARTYLVMALKGVVQQCHDVVEVYRKVSAFISQRVQTRPSDYMVSELPEIQEESQYTASIRKKRLPKKVT